jgi:hypothetical protein
VAAQFKARNSFGRSNLGLWVRIPPRAWRVARDFLGLRFSIQAEEFNHMFNLFILSKINIVRSYKTCALRQV